MKKLALILFVSVICAAQTSITGKLGTTGTTQLQIVSAPSGFSVSISPSVIPIVQGGTNTATVTVTSQGSFSAAVTLSTSGLSSGVSSGFSPNPITPSAGGTATSTLTLTASGSAAVVTCSSFTLTATSGAVSHSVNPCVTVTNSSSNFYAQVPMLWVNNIPATTQTPDVTITLDGASSTNYGPNCHNGSGATAPPVCGNGGALFYTKDIAGLTDAGKNWRDNAAQGNVGGFTYADKGWLIQIPPESTGTLLSGHSYDSNGALWSAPAKFVGGIPAVANMPTKYLVINSTTPNATGVMVCGRGLPGLGGTRNPGCSSPNDKNNMWHIQMDGCATNGCVDIEVGQDPDNPIVGGVSNYANHILIENVEADMAGGVAQSGQGSYKCANGAKCGNTGISLQVDNGANHYPSYTPPSYIGVMYSYFHGNDPGDPGQPSNLGGSIEDSAGTCSQFAVGQPPVASPQWGAATTVSVINTDGSHGTLTRASGQYFGPSMAIGNVVTLGSFGGTIVQYTITAVNYQNQVLTVSGQPATDFPSGNPNFSATNSSGNITSVQSQFTPGCGDDMSTVISFNCDQCWLEHNYIEKVHDFNSESHASSQGFSNGPLKEVDNWEEGGSCTWFSGGAPVDVKGGPAHNYEVRRNILGRDLNYRFLTGGAGNSPNPPFGCGSLLQNSGKGGSCPFSWAIKNSMEFKLGRYGVIDGNMIEDSWADGQSGFAVLLNIRTCSGGAQCGVFDPTTGIPLTTTDNIRFSNNWVRNSPQSIQFAARSTLTPGDGGGVSYAMKNMDFINNLFSNIGDTNQWGSPGYQFVWSAGQDFYDCAMSVVSGTGTPSAVAQGNCFPHQGNIAYKVSNITRSGGVVTVSFGGLREDPFVCLSPLTSAQCLAKGQLVFLANEPGWNGAFAISGTNGTQFAGSYGANGTGGNQLTYNDSQSADGVLCDNKSGVPASCAKIGLVFTMASLASSIHDISPGDAVYTSNENFPIATATESGTTGTYVTAAANTLQVGDSVTISGASVSGYNGTFPIAASPAPTPTTFSITGLPGSLAAATGGTVVDNSCTLNNFAVGNTVSTLACDGTACSPATNPASLIVDFPAPNATGTALCVVDNGAGNPKNVSFQNNTILSPTTFAITSYNTWWQSLSNQFYNNIFADNDAKSVSDLYCTSQNTEGTNSFPCWSNSTLGFYRNVMTARNSSLWSVVNCPGGTCTNSFPTTVNCTAGTATSDCLGFTAFMNSSPTIQFPGQGKVTTSGTAVTWSSGAKFLTDGSLVGPTYAISTATESGTTGTYTTTYTNNISKGDSLVISGVSVSGYNGTFTVATVGKPNPNNFTITGLPGSLGAATGGTAFDQSGGQNISINYVPYLIVAVADSTHLTLKTSAGTQSSPVPYTTGGACPAANAPFNCPLMALPWANNFTLANLAYVGSSSYSAYGAVESTIQSAMTNSIYTCPSGATCGSTATTTQVSASPTLATYFTPNTYTNGEYLTSIAGCSHSQFNQTGVTIAAATPSYFTVAGSYTNQMTTADTCTALNGPAPD